MVYFEGLGSGFMFEGLMLSNGSLGAKIGAKCAQMEAWRVQNGAQWPKMEASRAPNATLRDSQKH